MSEIQKNKKSFIVGFGLSLSNPTLIYCLTWGVALFLYNLELTTNILGLNNSTIYLVISSIASFIISYFIITFWVIALNGYKINLRKNYFNEFNTLNKLNAFKKIIIIIAFIWGILTLVEIIEFGGIPLITVVILKQFDLDYASFGLSTLHGLLNALYLTIVCSVFILYQSTKKRKYFYITLVLLFWPLFLMSRALIIWTLLEIFSIYFFFNSINIKKLFSLFSIVLLVIFIFGYIGDNRGETRDQGAERFTDTFVKDENRFITDKIPSGFIWVYLYVTTPLNNIVWNIENLKPEYNFKYTFAALLPSILRDDVKLRSSNDTSMQLFQEAFNVSSYFANYMRDFGVIGASIFIFFLQLYVLLIYQSAKKFKLGGMIAYATLFNSVVMSIFFDYFFSLVTVFQVLLGLFINYILYSKSNVKR